MDSQHRYIEEHIKQDLQKKMVFLGGPRQCGKTTLSKSIQDEFKKLKNQHSQYFNWDYDEDRINILKQRWHDDDKLIILDEIHKYPRWKNWIKGIYDKQKDLHKFLITGSARLDVYKRGGDSLLGRYHYWRLHPFGLDELPKGITPQDALKRLMTVGGFPEPFFDNNEISAKRWRRERLQRVIKDDIRDLESIKMLNTLELFLDALRERVGSPVVLSNIANDLQVAAQTLKSWLDVLEKMYLVFVVRPYTTHLARAIQKPPKVYFYDTGDVHGDIGARFENVVAAGLLKRLNFLEDSQGDTYELRYLRDKDGREVDFVVVKNKMPIELIEVKFSDKNISSSLQYYAQKLNPTKVTQVVAELKSSYSAKNIYVKKASDYLQFY